MAKKIEEPGKDAIRRNFLPEEIGASADARDSSQSLIQQSAEKYASLFNSIDQGFCIIEVIFNEYEQPVDYRFVEVNSAFEKQTGLQNVTGKTMKEMVPEHEQYWFDIYGKIAKTGECLRFENEAKSLKHFYEIYTFPTGKPGENLVAVLFKDISERKQSERNLDFLSEVSQDLLRLNHPDEMINQLSAKIGKYFGVKQCNFANHADEYKTAIVSQGWNCEGSPDLKGTYAIKDFLTEDIMSRVMTGQTIVVSNTQIDPDVNAENYRKLGILSFVLVPLVRNGGWLFQISIIDNKTRTWRKDEIELLIEIANRIWIAMERVWAEEKLQNSEERLQLATDAGKIGTFIYFPLEDRGEPDNQMLALYGLPQDGTLNLAVALADIIHPDDRQRYGDDVANALDPKGTGRLDSDIRIIHPDSSLHWINVTAQTIFEGDPPQAIRMQGVSIDITERKQAEATVKESEEKYRNLFTSMDEGYCIIEFFDGPHGPLSDYVHIEANPAYLANTGISNVVGQKVRDMVPDEAEEWVKIYRNVLITGKPVRFQRELVATGRNLELSAFRIEPEECRQVAVLFKDITESKLAEESLRQSEENYRVIVNQTIAGILKTDMSGRITFANNEMEKLLGYNCDELLQMTVPEIIHEKDIEKNNKLFERLKNEGLAYDIEKKLQKKDGSYVWVNNQISPIFDKKGKPMAAVMISIDISEQKAIEKQKDDFINVASHELKTPLTSIKAYGQILQDQLSDNENNNFKVLVERLNAQIERLTKLVQGLLDTGAVAKGKMVLHHEEFDLNQLIEKCTEEAQLTTTRHQLIFKPGDILSVNADAERIGQVLTNLISNAIKYSPEANEILITSENIEDREVKVSVQDFGIGLTKDARENIFKRFYQVENTSPGFAGLGLGLYISLNIIKAHGGKLGVSSEPGYGSVFYFSLSYAANLNDET